MFEHVLVATDSSTYSQAALPAAIEIAGQFDSEILVLHVREHDRGRAVVYSLETPARVSNVVSDAVKKLHDLGRSAMGQVRDVGAGHVAKAIVETAEANGVDLIVMCSRDLSEVLALLLGSVTHADMQAAAMPLLVVRPPVRETSRRDRRVRTVDPQTGEMEASLSLPKDPFTAGPRTYPPCAGWQASPIEPAC